MDRLSIYNKRKVICTAIFSLRQTRRRQVGFSPLETRAFKIGIEVKVEIVVQQALGTELQAGSSPASSTTSRSSSVVLRDVALELSEDRPNALYPQASCYLLTSRLTILSLALLSLSLSTPTYTLIPVRAHYPSLIDYTISVRD